MGIKDLLPLLKNCTEHCHISDFKGKRIAIDAFVWLHKASYFCSKDLYFNPGTKKILSYVIGKLKILLDNELQPFFVFDGRSLPIKGNVNDARRQIRDNAKEKIAKFIREGRENQITSTDYSAAVSIRYDTVKTFINFLKKHNISYLVAPYEADAQLAYLARSDFVDLVLTEDSDLLAYGVPQVLFKLNFDGYVDSIKIKDAITLFHFNDRNNATSKTLPVSKKKGQQVNTGLTPKSTDFFTFTRINGVSEDDYNDFLTFCILSGCDYAPHIKYVGPKLALTVVQENHSSIDSILQSLSLKKRVQIPPNYKQAFERAKKTFMHQKIYNIDLKRILPLSPILTHKSEINFAEDFDYEFAGKTFYGKELSMHIKGEIDSKHTDQPDEDERNDDDYDHDDYENENEKEENFDDRNMNENFLPFTKSFRRTKSELVIPFYKFKPTKKSGADGDSKSGDDRKSDTKNYASKRQKVISNNSDDRKYAIKFTKSSKSPSKFEEAEETADQIDPISDYYNKVKNYERNTYMNKILINTDDADQVAVIEEEEEDIGEVSKQTAKKRSQPSNNNNNDDDDDDTEERMANPYQQPQNGQITFGLSSSRRGSRKRMPKRSMSLNENQMTFIDKRLFM